MAIKVLKQNISICEIQKMIHQWKARGITESACLKLLDLYLGLPPYMTAEGIYPLRNFYQISQSLKTTHTRPFYWKISESAVHLDLFGMRTIANCLGSTLHYGNRYRKKELPKTQILLPVQQLQLLVRQLQLQI